MSNSLIEQTRAFHEDVERFQREVVSLQLEPSKTHKDKVSKEHKVNKYLNLIGDRSEKLLRLYDDRNGARKHAIDSIAGSGPELFSLFYDMLRETRAYHHRFPELVLERPEDVAKSLVMEGEELNRFTGEEGYGRFVDLNEQFTQFLNLKQNRGKEIDYLTYLEEFYQFDDDLKVKDRAYKRYLEGLSQYLRSFFERAKPLFNFEQLLQNIDKDFNEQWSDGGFRWGRGSSSSSSSATKQTKKEKLKTAKEEEEEEEEEKPNGKDKQDGNDDEQLEDLLRFSSVEELEELGMDRLKRELQKRGMLCGGTAAERAARLWLARDTPLSLLDPSLFASSSNKQQPQQTNNSNKKKAGRKSRRRRKKEKEMNAQNNAEFHQQVTRLEFEVNRMADALSEELDSTRAHIEKKLSRTPAEMILEKMEEEGSDVEAGSEDDEEEEVIIGKQNYPVGWDGKPIPYWLYRLHGLAIQYKCEICGDATYSGRRNFEKHFQEAKHASGMRKLGIPNTRHFWEVTKIQDALDLWEKLKKEMATADWRPDEEMEFEDEEGNVMNKKTYEDLKAQGLLKS
ncbi:Splicing factor 3A subunit 3 [Balamuthia mandrillaris]